MFILPPELPSALANQPAKLAALLVLLDFGGVARSGTPSPYFIYDSVRASLLTLLLHFYLDGVSYDPSVTVEHHHCSLRGDRYNCEEYIEDYVARIKH
ncbi:MAG: hypothetical protein JWL85_509 [Candidatus Saccharibacteria bacterium]|nr:hypothetical protein [Candidatus Saccharibacteria bacterium]